MIPLFGYGIFWISFVIGIILFIKSRKFYPVFYLVSIALYVYTAGFIIDTYNLQRLGIMFTLVISAIIFMLLGFYFSRIIKHKDAK